jgi:hypothetical protein
MRFPSILRRPSAPAAIVSLALLLAAPIAVPPAARAMCTCFPCDDCNITNAGQVTFIVLERELGTVRVIPNILLNGSAAQFALIVPTPVVPELAPVDKELWTQVSALTAAPVPRFTSDGGSGCGRSDDFAVPGNDTEDAEIIVQRTIGAFIATTIRSTDPRSLVAWLIENDFEVSEAEAQVLARYVARNWVFTAMKLDPSSPEAQVPDGGWNVNVNPLEFRYPADGVDVPLDLMSVNRSFFFPVRFYVVDDHRRDIAGFTANYANRISEKEFDAIEARFPQVAARLAPGRFLTRLERTFTEDDAMDASVSLARAATDDEAYWPGRRFGPTIPLESVVFLLVPAGLLRRRPGR